MLTALIVALVIGAIAGWLAGLLVQGTGFGLLGERRRVRIDSYQGGADRRGSFANCLGKL